MKILAVYSIKGGVGKTATAVNLAYSAAQQQQRVLVWDLDPQGASSFYFRIKPRLHGGSKKLIHRKKRLPDFIKATNYDYLDLLPADFSNRYMDLILDQEKKSAHRFSILLKQVRNDYDLAILDCPPSISLVSENVFHAADVLLVPVIPTHLSFRTYDQLKKHLRKETGAGLLLLPFLSMIDRRKKMHKAFTERFAQAYPEGLNQQISYSSVIEMMGEYRAPVEQFARSATAAKELQQLWQETWHKLNTN